MESVRLERITVAVYGLSQDGEATNAAECALLRVPGVSRAYVSAATEMAYVEYDPTQTTQVQILRALEDAGFSAGEVNVRSVGSSLPPLAAVRRAVSSRSERDAPDILGDSPSVVAVSVARRAAPDVSLSNRHDGTAAQAHRSRGAGWSTGHLPGLLRGKLPAFAAITGLVAALGILLWLAAAGQPVPENTFAVEAGASGFRPQAVVIPAGKPATLRVRNGDLAPTHASTPLHQFAISELGISVKLQPGQTTVIELPPLQPATYHYYCGVCCGTRNDLAMQGTLIVH